MQTVRNFGTLMTKRDIYINPCLRGLGNSVEEEMEKVQEPGGIEDTKKERWPSRTAGLVHI